MTYQKKNKVVIVGAGKVGEAVAYTLILSRSASEVVLIDVNRERAEGSALDINHGIAFYKQITIRMGEYSDCADAGIIIIAAGMPRKPGQTRLELAKTNVSIARQITKSIMRYAENPIIIVISNPVDILTYVVQKESGLPRNRVIGTGTLLDTARFRYLISEKCGVDVRDVNAYILGEHGDSQVPIWSMVMIAGIPLQDFCKTNKLDLMSSLKEIGESVKHAGATVISLKGATYYGIALNTSRVVDIILENDNTVLPVCHVVEEEVYGVSDVAFSLPCVINTHGIVRMLELSISEEETQALRRSAQILKDFIDNVLYA